MKSDDLLKREFKADKPCEKCITDITEIKEKDGKLYTSVIFDFAVIDLTANYVKKYRLFIFSLTFTLYE